MSGGRTCLLHTYGIDEVKTVPKAIEGSDTASVIIQSIHVRRVHEVVYIASFAAIQNRLMCYRAQTHTQRDIEK
jgi:hypothetical protein